MIRIVLAVLLSTALLAVGLPAADTARSQRAARVAAAEADSFAAAADRLARRNDAVPAGTPGATRLVVVRVPHGTSVRIRDGRLSWSQHGRTHRVETTTPLAGTLTLGAGPHRLRLALHWQNDRRVVTVRRFKSERAATAPRVRLDR